MKKRALAGFTVSGVLGGAMLASACSGRWISHRDDYAGDDLGKPGGTAGKIDRGGTSGTAGTIPPTGGVGGTRIPDGGTSGFGGAGGAGVSGSGGVTPSCTAGGGPVG